MTVTPTELFQPPLLVPLDFPFLKENFPVVSGLGDLGGGVGGLEGGAAVFCPSAHLTEWARRGAGGGGLGAGTSFLTVPAVSSSPRLEDSRPPQPRCV